MTGYKNCFRMRQHTLISYMICGSFNWSKGIKKTWIFRERKNNYYLVVSLPLNSLELPGTIPFNGIILMVNWQLEMVWPSGETHCIKMLVFFFVWLGRVLTDMSYLCQSIYIRFNLILLYSRNWPLISALARDCSKWISHCFFSSVCVLCSWKMEKTRAHTTNVHNKSKEFIPHKHSTLSHTLGKQKGATATGQ